MKWFREIGCGLVAAAVGGVLFVGVITLGTKLLFERAGQYTIDEGYAAAGAGVPATANPYQFRDPWSAKYWLHGYNTYLYDKKKAGAK